MVVNSFRDAEEQGYAGHSGQVDPVAALGEALRRLSLPPHGIAMVGDRRMDMDGARRHGLRGIGVLWGFGDAAELRDAGADALVAHPRELPGLFAA